MKTLGEQLNANDGAALSKAGDSRRLSQYEVRRNRNLEVARQFFEQARQRFSADIAGGKTSHELGIRVCRSHRVWNVYGFDSGPLSFGCAAKVGDYYRPWREFVDWAEAQSLEAYWQSVSNADTGAVYYVLKVSPKAH